jgi:recombination protein RecT
MDSGKMVRTVLMAVNQNTDLLRCSFSSLMAAVIKASSLGLYCDGLLGHAYIVPFYSKQAKGFQANLIPGYRGLVDLAYRSNRVASISAHAAREKDVFDYEFGLNERLKHIPAKGNPEQRGDITHAYCVVKLKNGGHLIEVITKAEAEYIRDKYGNKKSFLWRDHFEVACIKTAIRRCLKLAPLSPEVAAAVSLDELDEAGLPQSLDLDLPLDLQPQDDGSYAQPPEQKKTQAKVDEAKAAAGIPPEQGASKAETGQEALI